MSDTFQTIVDRDATATEAPQLATTIRQWLVSKGIVRAEPMVDILRPGPHFQQAVNADDRLVRSLANNELSIVIKRTVFDSGQNDFELICGACSTRFEPTDAWQEAVDAWYQESAPGDLSCPHCGGAQPITEWRHDPPWGFANLGFQFRNWPALNEIFVREFGQRLGHRIVLVVGKY